MNEEEKWLKTKIENVVESSASNRLARIKEKAVSFDEEYETPVKKKRSILRIAVTSVSCVIFALTVAVIAASPFIFNAPPTVPGDTTEKGVYDTESKEDIRYVPIEYAPVEETSDTELGPQYPVEEPPDQYPVEELDYFNNLYFELERISGISLANSIIEDIYICDFPSGEIYKNLSVYREGKALAVKIGKSNGLSETVYFYIDSEYYLKNASSEDFVIMKSPEVDEITRGIELTYRLMLTSPLVVCKSSASAEAEFSSVEEILECVGCVVGDMKAEKLKFYFENESVETPHLGISLENTAKAEYNTYELICGASYDEVKSRFEKYREDADPDGASVFYVPVSALTDDDIDFIAYCIVPNMSGILRNEEVRYEDHLAKILGCEFADKIESIETVEESGKYRLKVRFSNTITEFYGTKSAYRNAVCEISRKIFDDLNDILASTGNAVYSDIYYAVCDARFQGTDITVTEEMPSYNDTKTSSLLTKIFRGTGYLTETCVVGAEWNNDDPSFLCLTLRFPYGTLVNAYFKYDFGSENDSFFFDNTSELDEESIKLVFTFISGAPEMTVFPLLPDLSACENGKKAMNELFHCIFANTAAYDVDYASLYSSEFGEYFVVVSAGHGKKDEVTYCLEIVEEVFAILRDKYEEGKSVNLIDSLTVEDVGFISKSYASLKSVPYELNSPVSPIPLPNYDPLTDAVNAITGKEYIEVESIDMFEIEYDMFFRIDVLDAEGGVTSYYVCGVGNDLFMACASGDDGAIADALMGCELRTYDECEEILNQIRPTEEDGVFAFDTFSFANDSELYKAGDPGVKTEGFVNTRPSGSDLPVSVLLEKAKAECTVEYDTVRIQFDPRSYVFSIDFYVKDVLGGDESVYIDLAGRTKLIVYGE